MIGYCISQMRMSYVIRFTALLMLSAGAFLSSAAQSSGHEHTLKVSVNPADGKYTIAMPGSASYALRAGIGAQVDGHWLRVSDYPQSGSRRLTGPRISRRSYRLASYLLRIERPARSDLSPARLFERAIRRYPGDGPKHNREAHSRGEHSFAGRERRTDVLIWEDRFSTIGFSPTVSAKTVPPLPFAILRTPKRRCIAQLAASLSTTARVIKAYFLAR